MLGLECGQIGLEMGVNLAIDALDFRLGFLDLPFGQPLIDSIIDKRLIVFLIGSELLALRGRVLDSGRRCQFLHLGLHVLELLRQRRYAAFQLARFLAGRIAFLPCFDQFLENRWLLLAVRLLLWLLWLGFSIGGGCFLGRCWCFRRLGGFGLLGPVDFGGMRRNL